MNTLRERVQKALNDDLRTREAGIEILEVNGVVTLGGIVAEPGISQAAETIADKIDGVVSVVNEIQAREDVEDDHPFDVSGTLDEDIIDK